MTFNQFNVVVVPFPFGVVGLLFICRNCYFNFFKLIEEGRSLWQGEAPTRHPDSNPYPLRGTVYRYDDPTEPDALEDWEVLQ